MSEATDTDQANRRKSPRVATSDSYGSLEGDVYTLSNWSKEGALIEDYEGALAVGDDTVIGLEVNTARGHLRLTGQARVVRRDGHNLAVQWWLKPSEDQQASAALVEFFLARDSTIVQVSGL